jgi:hypothetical protein
VPDTEAHIFDGNEITEALGEMIRFDGNFAIDARGPGRDHHLFVAVPPFLRKQCDKGSVDVGRASRSSSSAGVPEASMRPPSIAISQSKRAASSM